MDQAPGNLGLDEVVLDLTSLLIALVNMVAASMDAHYRILIQWFHLDFIIHRVNVCRVSCVD